MLSLVKAIQISPLLASAQWDAKAYQYEQETVQQLTSSKVWTSIVQIEF